jgi:hypothetical protein
MVFFSSQLDPVHEIQVPITLFVGEIAKDFVLVLLG